MVSDRDFMFHISISYGKIFSLASRSRSSAKVKVKNHGHILQRVLLWEHEYFSNISFLTVYTQVLMTLRKKKAFENKMEKR